MSVLRQQFGTTLSITSTDGETEEFDLFGPESALAPPYAENSDHVVIPRQVRQNEAGWVVIDGWNGSALAVANMTVDIEIWARGSSAAQRGLEAPLFPSGAAAAADPSLKRVVASGLGGTDALIDSLFGGALGGQDSKDVPAVHLRAEVLVKIRLANATGGDIGPVVLVAKYDLGGNVGDTHRLA
jgi:hypothetical protein